MARARGGKASRPSKVKRAPVSTRARARMRELEARERERERAWQATVEADSSRRRSLAQTLEGKLYLALEAMQDRTASLGYRIPTLATRRPQSDHEYEAGVSVDTDGNRRDPQGQFVWKSPWALVGRIAFRPQAGGHMGYADLHAILNSWVNAPGITKRIGKDRLARIRVEYVDSKTGEGGEYQLAETFGWNYGLERAIGECDPDRGHSLAKRYASSVVVAVVIWFAATDDPKAMRFVRRRP